MKLLMALQALLAERAQHMAAIHEIDEELQAVRRATSTRRVPHARVGRPDVSSDRILGALGQREPLTTAELRAATGLRKTTLEAALRKLCDHGAIMRDPLEWKGPNGGYRYVRAEVH